MTKRATIFINASSGFDEKEGAPELIETLFKQSGIDTDVQHIKAGVNLADMARDAIGKGSTIVVAGGGDGTLSATSSALVSTEATFGVLPVGTLNHFARDLNIPLDLEQAARVILNGNTIDVDVAEVNGKTFLNNSILGLYPIYRFIKSAEQSKGWSNKLALIRAVSAVLYRYPVLKLRFYVKGEEVLRTTPYVLIANNEHAMEGWDLGTRRNLTEGKLWIYVLRPKGRLGLIKIVLNFLTRQFSAKDDFEIFSAEEIWVDAKRKRIGVALDGEVTVMEAPLRYRTLPRALKVFVP